MTHRRPTKIFRHNGVSPFCSTKRRRSYSWSRPSEAKRSSCIPAGAQRRISCCCCCCCSWRRRRSISAADAAAAPACAREAVPNSAVSAYAQLAAPLKTSIERPFQMFVASQRCSIITPVSNVTEILCNSVVWLRNAGDKLYLVALTPIYRRLEPSLNRHWHLRICTIFGEWPLLL